MIKQENLHEEPGLELKMELKFSITPKKNGVMELTFCGWVMESKTNMRTYHFGQLITGGMRSARVSTTQLLKSYTDIYFPRASLQTYEIPGL